MVAWFGEVERIGVEGTGSYGAGITRFLRAQTVEIVEVNCPNRQRRRSHGKSDPIDAVAAAKAVLSGDAVAEPKSRSGNVEAIRALRVADRSARHARVKALNQMRALLLTGPDDLREQFRGTTVWQLVRGAARLRPGDPTTAVGGTKYALRLLAKRVLELEGELAELKMLLKPLVAVTAPELVARHGVGTETAGALLVAVGDNPERLRDERAFAHFCGVSPIDASSGTVVRKRLNRGGHRHANEALWRIVMVRLVSDPDTRPTWNTAPRKGSPSGKPSGASSATWLGSSTRFSPQAPLDFDRSINLERSIRAHLAPLGGISGWVGSS